MIRAPVAFPTGTVFAGKDTSGFLGGVQGGYNWQASNFVLGVEGEYTWADLSGTSTTVSAVNGSWIPVQRLSRPRT